MLRGGVWSGAGRRGRSRWDGTGWDGRDGVSYTCTEWISRVAGMDCAGGAGLLAVQSPIHHTFLEPRSSEYPSSVFPLRSPSILSSHPSHKSLSKNIQNTLHTLHTSPPDTAVDNSASEVAVGLGGVIFQRILMG